MNFQGQRRRSCDKQGLSAATEAFCKRNVVEALVEVMAAPYKEERLIAWTYRDEQVGHAQAICDFHWLWPSLCGIDVDKADDPALCCDAVPTSAG